MRPIVETSYGQSGDVHLAYQVVGQGDPTVVFMREWATHVEAAWEDPAFVSFVDRLAAFSRVILFDKRGVGLSDPVAIHHLPTLEEWMDDLVIVMDAAGADRVVPIAADMAGFMAILFAATYPERTSGLVLANTTAKVRQTPDYPEGLPDPVVDDFLDLVSNEWGTAGMGPVTRTTGSSLDEDLESTAERYQRQTASPGTIRAMAPLLTHLDVRSMLPSVSVPTLVLHRSDDRYLPVAHGRYLAEHIATATMVELPGREHWITDGDHDAMLDEIEQFLTGARHSPSANRVLCTTLFTDIVGSTPLLAAAGDRDWRQILDRHDDMAERLVRRFQGRVEATTGDGLLATFDGPSRAVRCAAALGDATSRLGIQIRAGIHTGEIERQHNDVSGIAVHLANRICSSAAPSQILVSRTVVDLVIGSGIEFEDCGEHSLKGLPDTWRLYAVTT